jgi:hypothetical protein
VTLCGRAGVYSASLVAVHTSLRRIPVRSLRSQEGVRKRKRKAYTELTGAVEKYDKDIAARQAELDALRGRYTDERRRVVELTTYFRRVSERDAAAALLHCCCWQPAAAAAAFRCRYRYRCSLKLQAAAAVLPCTHASARNHESLGAGVCVDRCGRGARRGGGENHRGATRARGKGRICGEAAIPDACAARVAELVLCSTVARGAQINHIAARRIQLGFKGFTARAAAARKEAAREARKAKKKK